MEMKTKLLNCSLLWEQLILLLFTCFSEEKDLSQEADVAEFGLVQVPVSLQLLGCLTLAL